MVSPVWRFLAVAAKPISQWSLPVNLLLILAGLGGINGLAVVIGYWPWGVVALLSLFLLLAVAAGVKAERQLADRYKLRLEFEKLAGEELPFSHVRYPALPLWFVSFLVRNWGN